MIPYKMRSETKEINKEGIEEHRRYKTYGKEQVPKVSLSISVIILNIIGLSSPIKSQRVLEWIRYKYNSRHGFYKRYILEPKIR